MHQPPLQSVAAHRFGDIDILRGISICAVVLAHISLLFPQIRTLPIPLGLSYLLFGNGFNGVSMFFAISGFVITFTSLRRFGNLRDMEPKVFYRVRFARIAPALFVLLGILSALHLANIPGFRIPSNIASLPRALFAVLTFHLNWLDAFHGTLPGSWHVLRSLSVEEMFYLFFPLCCVAFISRPLGMHLFRMLLLVFVVLGPFARTVFSTNGAWLDGSYLSGMDGIALGCLTALLARQWAGPLPTSRIILLRCFQFLGCLMIAMVMLGPWSTILERSGTDATIVAVGTCFVMLCCVLRESQPSPLSAPIRWAGRDSYEIYLTHEFAVIGMAGLYRWMNRGPVAIWVLCTLLLTALLGGAFARYFSEPMNRSLRRGIGLKQTATSAMEPN